MFSSFHSPAPYFSVPVEERNVRKRRARDDFRDTDVVGKYCRWSWILV